MSIGTPASTHCRSTRTTSTMNKDGNARHQGDGDDCIAGGWWHFDDADDVVVAVVPEGGMVTTTATTVPYSQVGPWRG
jgi:hypothetical protein